jgi:hypothetical protein
MLQETELCSLFWRYELDDEIRPTLPSMVRRASLSIMGQLWWRCACFGERPFKLGGMIDDISDPTVVANAFRNTHACCKDQAFSQKVMRLFDSADEMVEDPEWLELLRVWSRCTRVTNMHIERSLAQVRRSAGKADAGASVDVDPGGQCIPQTPSIMQTHTTTH